jgi:undecaprenyl-diphosphatase
VQGVAEVVPVSSSAQLTLLPWLLGWSPPAHRTAFAAGLHGASALGVTVGLRREVRTLAAGQALLVTASAVPAAVVGAAVGEVVERRLGRPTHVAALLAAAGGALWLADRRPQSVTVIGRREATAAALAQVVALAPGVSRSGAALTALRACRVERGAATRFSLLMALPVTIGAAAWSLGRADRRDVRALAGPFAAGAPVAALTAWGATRASRRRPGASTSAAVAYRLAVAALVLRRRRSGAA